MSKRKTGFTLAEHREMGKRIKRAMAEWKAIRQAIASRYSVKLQDRLFVLGSAFFDYIRCELDRHGFGEHRDQFSQAVYYGDDAEKQPDSEQLLLENAALIEQGIKLQIANKALQRRLAEQAREATELRSRVGDAMAVLDPADVF